MKRLMVAFPGRPEDTPHEENEDCLAAGCIPLDTLKENDGQKSNPVEWRKPKRGWMGARNQFDLGD
jgi:hypothetical protein